MTRDEAVQKLATVGRLSIAHAEDLYDTVVPKPVVPQYVADWYKGNNGDLNGALFTMTRLWDEKSRNSDFYRWFRKDKEAFQTIVNMHQFGYEVESENEYVIKLKNSPQILLYEEKNEEYYFAEHCGIFSRESHTRKELEGADFGWVFNCEGVEVKEVG